MFSCFFNREHPLIIRAEVYLDRDEPLPLDLFADMMAAGLDVEEIVRSYKNSK